MRTDPRHLARQQYTNMLARSDIASSTKKTLDSEYLNGRKMVSGLLAYVMTILVIMFLFKLAVS